MKELQIDVIGPVPGQEHIIKGNLYIDGRCTKIWMASSDYELLHQDGIFIRDGKELDSANVMNTTNVFIEKQ